MVLFQLTLSEYNFLAMSHIVTCIIVGHLQNCLAVYDKDRSDDNDDDDCLTALASHVAHTFPCVSCTITNLLYRLLGSYTLLQLVHHTIQARLGLETHFG